MNKLIVTLVLAALASVSAIQTASAVGGGQSPTTIGNQNPPTIKIVFPGGYKGKGAAAGGQITEVGNAFDPKAGSYDDGAVRDGCLADGGTPVRRFIGDGFYWTCRP